MSATLPPFHYGHAAIGAVFGFLAAHVIAWAAGKGRNFWRALVDRQWVKLQQARHLLPARQHPSRQYRRQLQREHVRGLHVAARAAAPDETPRSVRRAAEKALVSSLRRSARKATGG
jgi:predicted outer membrane protein